MRLLVCGGRGFGDYALLCSTLNSLPFRPTVLIHGAARGADSLAGRWAEEFSIPLTEAYPADWNKHGRSAGYVRNAQMLKEGKPDFVVGFHGGRGTTMMLGLARKAGVPVMHIEEGPQ